MSNKKGGGAIWRGPGGGDVWAGAAGRWKVGAAGQVGAGPGEGIKKRVVLTTLSSDLLCKDRRIRPIP